MVIQCDYYEKRETILDGEYDARNFINVPTCEIDIDYNTTLIEGYFKVYMIMSATIMDGDISVICCKAPFVLKYTLEKYQKYGRKELIKNCFREIEFDGFQGIKLTIDVFLFSRMQDKEGSFS